MKLRNKKTGEIHKITKAVFLSDDMNKKFAIYSQSDGHNYAYRTLAELNAEWEDYEEQKFYWYIDCLGDIYSDTDDGFDSDKKCKQIGNYFSSREEAEKAVEKLKAWKRLKDKGFRFTGVAGISNNIYVSFETDSKYNAGHVMYDEYSNTDNKLKEYNEDLDLLFGGEK